MAKQQTKTTRQLHENPPVWEWIVAAIGFVLVAGTIGFMLYQTVTEKDTPPNFSVKVDSIVQTEGGYLVKFRVKNSGETSAGEVTIKGELKRDAEIVEGRTVKLTYVPSNSERDGGLLFSENPNELQLKLRVEGYEKP